MDKLPFLEDDDTVDEEEFTERWSTAERLACDYTEIADSIWATFEEEYRDTGSVMHTDGVTPDEWFRREFAKTNLSAAAAHDVCGIVGVITTAIETGLPRSSLVIDVAVYDDGLPRCRISLYPVEEAA